MCISGLGWGALAAMDSGNGQFATWLPDLPKWIYLVVTLLLLVGAFGFYHFHSWGWIVALLYILLGVVSLISQLVEMLIQFDSFLFLLPSIGVISLPYLFHRRNEFFDH